MERTTLAQSLTALAAAASRRGILAAAGGGLLAAIASSGSRVNETVAKGGKRKHNRHHKRTNRRKRKQRFSPPPPPSGPISRVDAVCSATPDDSGLSINHAGVRLAQTFTALASGQFARADIAISRESGSPGDYVLQLGTVDTAGVPTNDVLATTSVAEASVPVGTSTVTFTFTSPGFVAAGVEYALIVSRPGSDDLLWRGHRGDTCGGRAFQSSDLTAPFVAPIPDLDFIFTTFVSS